MVVGENRQNEDIPETIDPIHPPSDFDFLVRVRASPLDAMKWAEQSNAAVLSMRRRSMERLALEVSGAGIIAAIQDREVELTPVILSSSSWMRAWLE
jgi:hypothetical protein